MSAKAVEPTSWRHDFDDQLPTQIAEAFAVYVGAAERSISETARLISVNLGTVKSWSYRYRWPERSREIDLDRVRGNAYSAMAVAGAQHANNVKRAIQIRDDPASKPSDVMEAIKWISAIGGLAAVNQVTTLLGNVDTDDRARAEAYAVDELQRLADSGDIASLIAIGQGRSPHINNDHDSQSPVILDTDTSDILIIDIELGTE